MHATSAAAARQRLVQKGEPRGSLGAEAIELFADGIEDRLEACLPQPADAPGDERLVQREDLVGADNAGLGHASEFEIIGNKSDAWVMVQLRGNLRHHEVALRI